MFGVIGAIPILLTTNKIKMKILITLISLITTTFITPITQPVLNIRLYNSTNENELITVINYAPIPCTNQDTSHAVVINQNTNIIELSFATRTNFQYQILYAPRIAPNLHDMILSTNAPLTHYDTNAMNLITNGWYIGDQWRIMPITIIGDGQTNTLYDVIDRQQKVYRLMVTPYIAAPTQFWFRITN